jgi:hypothetical protein
MRVKMKIDLPKGGLKPLNSFLSFLPGFLVNLQLSEPRAESTEATERMIAIEFVNPSTIWTPLHLKAVA